MKCRTAALFLFLWATCANTDSDATENTPERAYELLKAGKFGAVESMASRMADLDATNLEAWYLLAAAQEGLGKLKLARQNFQRATEGPEWDRMYAAYFKLGNIRKARRRTCLTGASSTPLRLLSDCRQPANGARRSRCIDLLSSMLLVRMRSFCRRSLDSTALHTGAYADFFNGHLNLGVAYRTIGRLAEAIEVRRCLPAHFRHRCAGQWLPL